METKETKVLEKEEETYIDILGQELIRDTVLVYNVVVHARTRSRRAEEETKEAAKIGLAKTSLLPFAFPHSQDIHPAVKHRLFRQATRPQTVKTREPIHSPSPKSSHRLPDWRRNNLLSQGGTRLESPLGDKRRLCPHGRGSHAQHPGRHGESLRIFEV
ncbi:hypothetical protein IAQ61_010553 [Plenodomus lingam]|uniref:uncharacterized protein n=1 Tax=Leptosphaeria maculans TaxID=5022 RepID=UPI003319545F|nr:hypothetical protein IAQ61_010553 [Plenodomus lingam]